MSSVAARASVASRPRTRAGNDAPRAGLVRGEIFERAVSLFEQKGFRATSMQDIASLCGVTKPAIYYYFRSKYHFLEELYEVITREFYDRADALIRSPLPPEAKLRRLVEDQVLYSVQNHRFQRLFQSERRELDQPTRAALARRERRYEALVTRIIEDGQSLGLFRALDAKLMMLAVLGLLSSVHRWAYHAGQPPQAVADGVVALVMNGLLLPGGSATPSRLRATGVSRKPKTQARTRRAARSKKEKE
jgi:AcrR family transcriptional regulator